MPSIDKITRGTVPAESTAPLQLSSDVAHQVKELITRLEDGNFAERKKSSRRADGEIFLSTSEDLLLQKVAIRLNSFSTGTSGVITLDIRGDIVEVSSFMRRDSRFGGDDRGEILIPTRPSAAEQVVVENMIYAACVCVGRGYVGVVRPEDEPTTSVQNLSSGGVAYALFFPSQNPLPYVDSDFVVRGLQSLY